MKYIVLSFCFLFSFSLIAKESSLGRKYFTNFLGHVHKNASKDSSSLTIVQCSHSVILLREKNKVQDWTYVKVGDDMGYVQSHFLSSKRPSCFQEKYPKFYNSLNMDITEMYFWGRLYDHYLQGKSRIK